MRSIDHKTLIFAHRGSKGTFPENTMASFKAAVSEQADGLETDVHLTRDGQMVLMHDEKVNRTTNGSGLIHEKTLAELKQLDAGRWFGEAYVGEQVPTLIELLDYLQTAHFDGILNIEAKTDKIHYDGIEAMIVALVDQQPRPFKVIYSSFHPASVRLFREIAPTAEVAALFQAKLAPTLALAEERLIDGLHPDIRRIRKQISELPDLPIRPWTVNKTEDMQYCLTQKFAGLITDYPTKARQLREQMEAQN